MDYLNLLSRALPYFVGAALTVVLIVAGFVVWLFHSGPMGGK